jgi:hypothetical protein
MRWLSRTLVSIVILFLLVFAIRLALVHRRHFSVHGHSAPLGLHADIIVSNASIGIPGITKMYEAELTNYGVLPIAVTRCEFVDDTLSHGTMVAYSVERWNGTSGNWESVVNMNGRNFCKPYPLGIVEARLTMKWLWPGQSLTTGEEATAARDPLQRGDSARFVVYLRTDERNSASIPTAAFPIDESPTVDAGALRVRN